MEPSSEILWPQELSNPGAEAGEDAPNVLGEPNGTLYVLLPERKATFRNFRGRRYAHLSTLLGANKVTHGDFVSRLDCGNGPDRVAIADVVAFEHNGTEPAPGGGWERCEFEFSDGTASVSINWSEGVGAARDAHVLANGSIRGQDYKAYFSLPSDSPLVGDSDVISFLLFALPELNTGSPAFAVTVKARSAGETASFTPDIDAIGLLRRGA